MTDEEQAAIDDKLNQIIYNSREPIFILNEIKENQDEFFSSLRVDIQESLASLVARDDLTIRASIDPKFVTALNDVSEKILIANKNIEVIGDVINKKLTSIDNHYGENNEKMNFFLSISDTDVHIQLKKRLLEMRERYPLSPDNLSNNVKAELENREDKDVCFHNLSYPFIALFLLNIVSTSLILWNFLN